MKKEAQFWIDHVVHAKLEAGSTSTYEKRHNISVAALYYWQRKLQASIHPRTSSGPSKFVALRVTETTAASSFASCILVLRSGLRLEMSALPAPEWLAAVGRAEQGLG